MSFATRMWARRLVNAAAATTRTSMLRPRAMPLKKYQPIRTMATAAQQEYIGDVPVTTINEDSAFGGK
jgi:hypothetical protein